MRRIASGGSQNVCLSCRLNVHHAFTQGQQLDAILRQCRPSADEQNLKKRCEDEIKRALRPSNVYLTGSVGKGTALRGEHDLDVVVVVPEGPTDHVMKRLRNALLMQGFDDVQCQMRHQRGRRLITAKYESLSLDILPVQKLEDDGWANDAWKSRVYFSTKLTAWKKDVVRVMKALLRLRFPDIPGILLESCVDKADIPSGHIVRNGIKNTLQRLADNCNYSCSCPCMNRDLMQDQRVKNIESEMQEYCLELLTLFGTPIVHLGSFCQESLICRHDLTVQFRFLSRCSRFFGHVSLDYELSRLMLGLPLQFQHEWGKAHLREIEADLPRLKMLHEAQLPLQESPPNIGTSPDYEAMSATEEENESDSPICIILVRLAVLLIIFYFFSMFCQALHGLKLPTQVLEVPPQWSGYNETGAVWGSSADPRRRIFLEKERCAWCAERIRELYRLDGWMQGK